MKKVLLLFFLLFTITGCGKKQEIVENIPTDESIVPKEEEKIDIIDVNSNIRPFAVVVNNSTVAVQVQTGLQEAYVVYEFPVEGGLTRLMALYKDKPNITIGTIRSARHNFIDYALEHDAIFVAYGWSIYAKDDLNSLGIDYANGVVHSGPFWRENPLNLASEHTAYTNTDKIKEFAQNNGFALTTDNKIVFNYSPLDVDLSPDENNKIANTINLTFGDYSSTTFEYDSANKNYKRIVNGNPNIDYYTKKQFTAKNIIIEKINYGMMSNNYYLKLETVGKGDGYLITNGYAIPIKWSKETRSSKTKYLNLKGEEIMLSDGNTYVELMKNSDTLEIK